MPNFNRQTYAKNEVTSWPIPNSWDLVALFLVLAVVILLGFGARSMVGQFHLGQTVTITLDPRYLPYYALRSVLRMFIALSFSLLFTFIFGTWAAKNRHAERLIIPMIDILQSVPVLGFLTITVPGFLWLFDNSLFGLEAAAIFAIFTAQVWNMTLSFYQSLRSVPAHFREAASMFQLSSWQTFWRVEVPYAMPGLIWNMMLSMSGSWVFLVASEAISVAHQQVALPGIGSYIDLAIKSADLHAIAYVIATMLVVIALYDQLLFRPLVAWANKFRVEDNSSEEESESWLLDLFQRTEVFSFMGKWIGRASEKIVNIPWLRNGARASSQASHVSVRRRLIFLILWYVLFACVLISALGVLFHFIFTAVKLSETLHVIYLGSITGLRVMTLIFISSLIWVPVGVWIGLRPKASQIVQPIAQFLAAFPANLLFPVVVLMIVRYHLNVNIWTSPLMILGTQWYLLFNVIAGVTMLPKNLHYVVGNLNVKGWLWWRKFILPGIFPYYITGAITAAGGAWNISIIAESVSWGNTHLMATGLGAYLAEMATRGDFARLALGMSVMSLFVLSINRFVWRPLYNLAQERYQL